MKKEEYLEYLRDRKHLSYLFDIEKIATYHPSSSMNSDSEYLIKKFKQMSKQYKYAFTCSKDLEKYSVKAGWIPYECKKYKLVDAVVDGKKERVKEYFKKKNYLRSDIWFYTNYKPDSEIFIDGDENYVDLQPNFSDKAKLLLCLDDMKLAGLADNVFNTLENIITSQYDFNDLEVVNEEDRLLVNYDLFDSHPSQWSKSKYNWYKQRVLSKQPSLSEDYEYIDEIIESEIKQLAEIDNSIKELFSSKDYKEPEYRIDIDLKYIENLKMR